MYLNDEHLLNQTTENSKRKEQNRTEQIVYLT